MLQKILRLTVSAAAVALLAFAVITMPAGAHSGYVSHGNDYAVTVAGHDFGSVCDRETDGNPVTAYWYDADGFQVAAEVDGGDVGCDSTSFNGTANTVVVCEASRCTDAHKV